MIDRRAFLQRLGFGTMSAAAAAVTFDVDKLLWVPRAIITVPAMPSALASTLEYQFAFNEGLRNKAARGTLLTNGTLRALARYTQQITDETYAEHVAFYSKLSDGR